MTRSTAALAVISTFVRGALAHAQDRSPLHGSLTPGPHAVGFSIVEMTDPTRYVRPERDATGPVDPAARARRLKVHLWYPALGFSGAGFSQLLLAMRHPDIDAVCDLESAIFDDRVQWPLQRGWGYDVAALRVPFLHTYSVPLSKLEVRIEDFEKMRYSTRYRYLVDAPGIHHWDFATEGMAASTILGNRGDAGPRLRQGLRNDQPLRAGVLQRLRQGQRRPGAGVPASRAGSQRRARGTRHHP